MTTRTRAVRAFVLAVPNELAEAGALLVLPSAERPPTAGSASAHAAAIALWTASGLRGRRAVVHLGKHNWGRGKS
ncbi:MAG TPA: hypothetical protein VEX12_15475 [Microbacterium sp.]|nr:hypothetical protein [Microbacterium sp.]